MMSRNMEGNMVILLLLFLLFFAADPQQSVFAAEGRIPICGPKTIDQGESGSYIVTQDFEVSEGPAITIHADHVTIDLDGHTITSLATNSSDVITNDTSGTRDIHLKNGKIIGKGTGYHINLESAGGEFIVEDVTAISPEGGAGGIGIRIAGASTGYSRAILRRNLVMSSYQAGVDLTYIDDGRIEENDVRGCLWSGIGVTYASNTVVARNTVADNNDGIFLNHAYNSFVTDNTLSDNYGYGLIVGDAVGTIVDRNASVKNGSGMNLATLGAIVSNNNVSDNFFAGILIVNNSTGCNIHHNTVARNGRTSLMAGIEVYGGSNYNTVDWNTCMGNGSYGILFDSGPTGDAIGNIYSFNRTLNNAAAGISPGIGNLDAGFNADSP